jgi:hypothetical protein
MSRALAEISSRPGIRSSEVLDDEDEEVTIVAEEGVDDSEEEESSNKSAPAAAAAAVTPLPFPLLPVDAATAGKWKCR